ncbi:MAG: LuxR family two component transcriptional regulator [Bacteroidetes bacterium]|nr:MAG: LuxR family two component transcriptional regulator [Bacteroidota bacterium]
MDHITTISNITTREKQILKLVAREYSTIEISSILRISVRTVETHRKNILRKINSRSLAGLTKHAIKLGLLEDYIYRPVIDTKVLRKPNKLNPD